MEGWWRGWGGQGFADVSGWGKCAGSLVCPAEATEVCDEVEDEVQAMREVGRERLPDIGLKGRGNGILGGGDLGVVDFWGSSGVEGNLWGFCHRMQRLKSVFS